MKLILYLVLMIILLNSVIALGVGPVQVYRVLEPGKTEEISIRVFNNEKKDLILDVSVRGELRNYIELKTDYIVDEDTGHIDITYRLRHPDGLSPGAHNAEIVVREVIEKSEATVVATQAHVSSLRLQSPVQGLYAEARLDVTETNFDISIYNYGTDDFTAYADIKAYADGLAGEATTKSKGVASMSQEQLRATIPLDPGSYNAVATVYYEDKEIVLEKDFNVGKKIIEILNISVDRFRPGDIARIKMKLENRWPESIEAVADIFITKDGTVVDTVTTETFTIDDDYVLFAYWNTKDYDYGTYNAEAKIVYGNEVSTEKFRIIISESDDNSILVLVGMIVLILSIQFYLWWKYFRK